MVLSEPVSGSTQPENDREARDDPPISPRGSLHNSAIAQVTAPVPKASDEERVRDMYADEKIDRALRRIDATLEDCHPDHELNAKDLVQQSQKAVEVVRNFRAEVLALTKRVLQSKTKAGNQDIRDILEIHTTVLLEPGQGPQALLKALGRVLEYTKAKSRAPVERERRVAAVAERFRLLEVYKEPRNDPKISPHEVGVAAETERIRHFMTFGSSLPTTQAKRPAGKPLILERLYKKLTRAVQRHLEGVVSAAEVRHGWSFILLFVGMLLRCMRDYLRFCYLMAPI